MAPGGGGGLNGGGLNGGGGVYPGPCTGVRASASALATASAMSGSVRVVNQSATSSKGMPIWTKAQYRTGDERARNR